MRERRRLQIYDSRWERVFQLVLGLTAIGTAVGNFAGWWMVSVSRALTMIMALLGSLVVAVVIQSGRNGRLSRLNYEAILELCSSAKARVVIGHDEIHQAERTVLANGDEEVRVLSYVGARGDARPTRCWGQFWRTLGERMRQNPNLHVNVVFSVDDETSLACIHKAVEPLPDQADVSVSVATPPFSCLIADDSALLAFPLGSADRGLAMIVEDLDVVRQLRIWFDRHVHRNVVDVTTFAAMEVDVAPVLAGTPSS